MAVNKDFLQRWLRKAVNNIFAKDGLRVAVDSLSLKMYKNGW